MPNHKKQFDCVIMNPPYQPNVDRDNKGGGKGSGSGHTIWNKFVDLAFKIIIDKGFIAAVHPVKWRKPDDAMYPIITGNHIHYLEMHTKKDGIKTFGASTPFDWYVLQKTSPDDKVIVKDTNGKTHSLDLSSFPFLPNFDFKIVQSLIAGPNDEKCEVLFSRSMYGSDKAHMRENKDGRFKHPCVHSTPKSGVRYWYSSKKGGFFGTAKIIFGEADTIQNAIVDAKGEFGITQQAIGLRIESKKEGEQIKKALESKRFNQLLQGACRWSQFRIDWRMFRAFRVDFWKEFV